MTSGAKLGQKKVGPSPMQNVMKGEPSLASQNVILVSEKEFEREVLLSELPVLIEFTAEWCQPCKTVAPVLHALAGELLGKAKIVTIDIDRSPFLAKQLRVQSIPTFMVFAEGRIQSSQVGAIGKKQMLSMIEPFFPRQAGAVKASELFSLLAQSAVCPVDIRDRQAFTRAHIPHAVCIPLEEIEGRLAELFMFDGPAILYCRSGDRSSQLVTKLSEQNIDVGFLEGGLLAWESEGLKIERGAPKSTL